MKNSKTIFIGVLLFFAFVSVASASDTVVKNMSDYGDGTYESNMGYIGNATGTVDVQRIQYFTVAENVSVEKMSYYINQNANVNVTGFTVILFNAYSLNDHNSFQERRLNISVSNNVNVGLHTIVYPEPIELTAGRIYGVHLLVDSDSDYSNHEGIGSGKTGYVYIQKDTSGNSSYHQFWDGSSWVANACTLNLTFLQNDSVIHATNIPTLNPTFSNIHSWSINPKLDTMCDTQWELNGHHIEWDNSSASPSVVISDNAEYFNRLQNNTLVMQSTDEVRGTLMRTIYINQTAVYIENVSAPGVNPRHEVDSNGVIWEYIWNTSYNSTDDLITRNLVSTTTGLNASGNMQILYWNDTVQFASQPGGVKRSIDGGKTFQLSLPGNFLTWSILKDSQDALYVATYSNAYVNSTVWKSDDMGNTWTQIFNPVTKHIHGMGFVGDTLYVATGDKNYPNTTAVNVGIWKSDDFGNTWTQLIGSQYQFTRVLDAGGIAVFGGDDVLQGIFCTVNHEGKVSTTLLNETYRNPIYDMRYDLSEGVIYALMANDFDNSTPIGIQVSADKGKTWHYLCDTPYPGAKLSNVSNSGWIYVSYDKKVDQRVHLIDSSVVSTLPSTVDVYCENALVTKNYPLGAYKYNVTQLYGQARLNILTQHTLNISNCTESIILTSSADNAVVFLDSVVVGNNIIDSVNELHMQNGLNYVVIPNLQITSTSKVSVNISEWEGSKNYHKVWTESSETHNAVTTHTIGGFPANTLIQINRDGVKYETVTSDASGTITWVYDGGYSTHEFEAFVADHVEVTSTNVNNNIWQTSVGMILVAVVVFFGTMLYQGIKKGKVESDTIILAAKGLIFIAMTLIVGAIILSAF